MYLFDMMGDIFIPRYLMITALTGIILDHQCNRWRHNHKALNPCYSVLYKHYFKVEKTNTT